jgi:sRNA-binding protein
MGPAYYRAVLRGGPRYDLDGNTRGEVTPEDQERAKQDLQAFYDRRKKKQAARVQAVGNGSPQGPEETAEEGSITAPSVSTAVDVKIE